MNKKKILITGLIVATLSGGIYLNFDKIEDKVNKFNFDFKIFLIEDEEKQTIKVKEVNLNDGRITDEKIKKINTLILDTYDKLGERSHFFNTIGNPKIYYEDVKMNFSETLYDEFIANQNHYIRQTMNDIYSLKSNGYYKTNIIGIKINDDSKYEVLVEVISIKENKGLMTEQHKLTLDNDLKIIDFKVEKKLKDVANSSSPLLIKNFDKMNAAFLEDLKANFSEMNNTYLYQNYTGVVNGEITDKDKTKEQLLREVELQKEILFEDFEFDIEVLDEIFMINEGFIKDYKISEYSMKKDETIYVVNFVYKNKLYKYNFTFNRVIDKITDIKKLEKNNG